MHMSSEGTDEHVQGQSFQLLLGCAGSPELPGHMLLVLNLIVECLNRDLGVAGSSLRLNSITVLYL